MPEHFRGYRVRTLGYELLGRSFELLAPADHDALLNDPAVAARFDQDEYLPYWAEVWPAALLLAEAMEAWGRGSSDNSSTPILDLGCGLGLLTLLALHLGYPVIAADYDTDALAFVVENARRNGLPIPQTRQLDWRETCRDLRVERMLAADVLYETRNLRPVAEFVYRHLTPRGFALIGDANRSTADAFDSIARHCGLSVETSALERPASGQDGTPVRGRIFKLARKASGG